MYYTSRRAQWQWSYLRNSNYATTNIQNTYANLINKNKTNNDDFNNQQTVHLNQEAIHNIGNHTADKLVIEKMGYSLSTGQLDLCPVK